MRHFNYKKIYAAMAVVIGLSSVGVNAQSLDRNSHLGKTIFKEHKNREARCEKPFDVRNVNPQSKEDRATFKVPNKVAVDNAANSWTSLPNFDYLDGPDGSTWYYTAKFTIEQIEHNEFWTEDIYKTFEFTIYDHAFNEVGTIKDEVRLNENESKANMPVLDPAISMHFFNTDDKYEVMVFFANNVDKTKDPDHDYHNHYFYNVYSIGGNKTAEGYDEVIAVMEGRCLDATNANINGGEEDFVYSFVTDPLPLLSRQKDPDALEYLHSLTYHIDTYKKATSDAGPEKFFEYDVYGSRIPGDTTDGIYLITIPDNGSIHYIYSQYDKPFFVDPRGGAVDESCTPDNSLKIQQYVLRNGEANMVSSTTIPIEAVESEEQLIYTFVSIGSVGYRDDVDMVVNGTKNAPAYIVTRNVCAAATLEDILSSYDIYGNDGKVVRNLGTDIESYIVFPATDGKQPQAMFITLDEDAHYQFSFVNLYSGEQLFTIDRENDGDPLQGTMDRVIDENGDYHYVFEMTYWDTDSKNNDYIRVAWFDNEGKLEHIDKIMMGLNVQAAQVFINSNVLKPTLYDDDDAMEYAVLVKRTYGAAARNEFMVVDDNNGLYATFSADDGKGDPVLFDILPGETNRLMIVYNKYNRYNIDLYDLPFLNNSEGGTENGVESVTDSFAGNVSYDGAAIVANGSMIEVYNTLGIMVAKGRDSVSVANLSNGTYVVVATDANGKQSKMKIAK